MTVNYFKTAEALMQAGKISEAILNYKKAIELNPNRAIYYYCLGNALLKLGKLEEATVAYGEAKDLNDKSFKTYRQLGTALFKQGKADEALVAFSQAITLNPKDVRSSYLQAKCWAKQDKLDEAIAAYSRAIKVNPSHWQAYRELGELLEQKCDYEEAIACYRQVAAIEPKALWPVHKLVGCLVKQGKLNEAISDYQQAIKANPEIGLKPNFPNIYTKIGILLGWQGQTNEAIYFFKKGIEFNPKEYINYSQLGRSQMSTGKLDEAIENLRKAIKLKPDEEDRFLLSTALAKQGNTKKAIENIKELIDNKWEESKGLHKLNIGEDRSPHFILIGSQKGGSTSLFRYLIEHPQIHVLKRKELHFFNRHLDKGLNWYLNHFPKDLTPGQITGEGTPNYFDYPLASESISNLFPSIKLIVILRNPAKRAISHYYHNQRHNQLWKVREPRPLKEALEDEIKLINHATSDALVNGDYYSSEYGYISRSLYVYHLKRWMNLFSREQFLILKSEDMFQNAKAVVEKCYEFLGIPNYTSENYPIHYKGSNKKKEEQVEQMLSDYFRPHNNKLEEYLDMEFNWG